MTLSEARRCGTAVVSLGFSSPNSVNEWVFEGPGQMFVEGGSLRIRSMEGGGTAWHTRRVEGDVLIEFVATVDGPEGAANVNAFVHATDPSGAPVYAGGRSGHYAEYHVLPLYIFTFTGAQPSNPTATGWSRVRKDPGFNMLSENPAYKARTYETYTISIFIEGPRIRYYINGELVHDCPDPDPYRSGWFALRTWKTNLSIHRLEIRELGA